MLCLMRNIIIFRMENLWRDLIFLQIFLECCRCKICRPQTIFSGYKKQRYILTVAFGIFVQPAKHFSEWVKEIIEVIIGKKMGPPVEACERCILHSRFPQFHVEIISFFNATLFKRSL